MQRLLQRAIFGLASLSFFVPTSMLLADQCLTYEPSVVTLEGKLIRKTFPGPPNYEDIAKGDVPETAWLLELSRPICVNQDEKNPDLNGTQKDVRDIQLVVDPKIYQADAKLVGTQVVATGSLFGAHTGHHHTDVLLTLKTLSQTREKGHAEKRATADQSSP